MSTIAQQVIATLYLFRALFVFVNVAQWVEPVVGKYKPLKQSQSIIQWNSYNHLHFHTSTSVYILLKNIIRRRRQAHHTLIPEKYLLIL